MYSPYLTNKVIELLSEINSNNLKPVYHDWKQWRLEIEFDKDINSIDVYFRDRLLVEYNLTNKIIYTAEISNVRFSKCWSKWENQARIGVCKYYHVRPERKSLDELYPDD